MKDWKQRLYDGYVSTGQAGYEEELDLNNLYYDKLIADHLPKNTKLSILDLACGHGRLIYSLKKHGYKNILGIDISAEQVAAAHKLGITEVRHLNINDFLENSKDKSYDVVFLMDILEHLEKQEVIDLLDNVNRILGDNGVVIMHVPNAAGIFGMRVRYGDFTHQNSFTPQSMQQILCACSFDSVATFEDTPIIHGLKSLVRNVLWHLLTFPFRLLLTAETGSTEHTLSQNIIVVATKSS